MSGRVTYNPATGRCQWAQYSASPGRALYKGSTLYVRAPGLAIYGWRMGPVWIVRDWISAAGPHAVTYTYDTNSYAGTTILYNFGLIMDEGGWIIGRVDTTITRHTDGEGDYWELYITMQPMSTSPLGWIKAIRRDASAVGAYTETSSNPEESNSNYRVDGTYSVSYR